MPSPATAHRARQTAQPKAMPGARAGYGAPVVQRTIYRHNATTNAWVSVFPTGNRAAPECQGKAGDFYDNDAKNQAALIEEPEAKQRMLVTLKGADAKNWEVLAWDSKSENCMHFAFGSEDHAYVADLASLKAKLPKGYSETSDLGQATVVLYGTSGISHAMVKNGGSWEEVSFPGGPHLRRGGANPPAKFKGESIVAMFKK